MKKYECSKCGMVDIFLDKRGTQVAICCGDCGKWLKWAGKNEIALLTNQGISIGSKPKEEVRFVPDTQDEMTSFENNMVMLFENNMKMLMKSLMKNGHVTNDFKEVMLDRLTDSMKEILRLE